MEKRKDKRLASKLYAKITSSSLTAWGLLNDISENGLFIRSNRDYTIDAVIDIEVFMPDKTVSLLKGVVRRIIELPEPHRKFGIGIELIEKDTTYKHFLKLLGEQRKTPVRQFSNICNEQGLRLNEKLEFPSNITGKRRR